MKSIALIHTVKNVANTFDEKVRDVLEEEVKIYNLLDDYLAIHPNEVGEFTKTNRTRLFHDLKNAELTGADLIVVTCSTLTPIVEQIRPFLSVPVIAIDDAMGRKAVTTGEKIMILATAESTIRPTLDKLSTEALKIGKKMRFETMVNGEAFKALKRNDMEKHDALLISQAETITDVDCIVLAQASMAHLEEEIEEITGIPVLSSPDLCLEEIRSFILGR
ncbi:aspartate/glutamate racemase family protein [Proteiniclasticum sp. C24MP]|uniref:aspartate/glutamate racemase family protein n=1 Tax=Proteiniclasticum sp. C24MP TaxID=3374101 RepID=UPI0037550C82